MSFGRLISLTIQTLDNEAILIEGLRIEFNVLKTEQGEPNECQLSVYNVSEATFDKVSDTDNKIILKSGYEDEGGVKTTFIGNSTGALFFREGTESRMEITAYDGQKDYRALPVSLSYKKGTTVSTVVRDILSVIPITVAKQTTIPNSEYTSGYAFIGKAFDSLKEVLARVGLTYTLQNNEIYILSATDTIEATAYLISKNTGMIESPVPMTAVKGTDTTPIDKKKYKVKTLLNPRLLPKSLIQIESRTAAGFFKILVIEHKGDNWQGSFQSELEVIEV